MLGCSRTVWFIFVFLSASVAKKLFNSLLFNKSEAYSLKIEISIDSFGSIELLKYSVKCLHAKLHAKH